MDDLKKAEKAKICETSDEDPIQSGKVSFSGDVEIVENNNEMQIND